MLYKLSKIIGWVLFIAASIAIQYEVKVVMNPAASGIQQTLGNVKVGQQAPDFTIHDLAGRSVSLSSYRGQKVVLMDFWATWCGPCKMAMPGLQELCDQFKGKGLEILSLDQGEEADQVHEFVDHKPYTFHVLLDADRGVGAAYGVKAIPTLVVVDKKGVVRWVSVGYSQNEVPLRQLLAEVTRE
jgi:peroxiredoxin